MAMVVKLARLHHWLVYHTHDSRRSARGFPDLILVHPQRGRILAAELKTAGRPTPEQALWLEALRAAGVRAEVWTPKEWGRIERALKGED